MALDAWIGNILTDKIGERHGTAIERVRIKMGKMIRLDKYLADMQVGSRTEVKQMMKKGQVMVDDVKVLKPEQKIDIDRAKVTVNGVIVGYAEYEYWMLHKPAGVVSATEDRHDKTVIDLLTESRRKDLFPVGRLDKDTEGLLLITNDGELAHELLSPKKHVDKTYFAHIDGIVDESDVKAFQEGLDIGEDKLTMPAELKILSVCDRKEDKNISESTTQDSQENPYSKENQGSVEGLSGTSRILVTIREGKFHQVKRMFEAVGKKVIYLKRLSMGSLLLDEQLAPGEARLLTEDELCGLKAGKTGVPVEQISDKYGKTAGNQEKGRDRSRIKVKYPEASEDGERKDDQIEAAIFDLDGTLIDSMWMWYRIDEEFLGQFGSPVPVDLQKSIEGMSFTETAEYFKERFSFLPYSVEQLKKIWNDMAYEKYAHEVALKPGIREYLTFLKERRIKTGIATSNSRELVEVALTNLGVRDYFDSIRTSCEVEKGKPAPDIYLKVADDLQARPERCLVFEDVPAGITAGNRAGMKTFAVADDFSAHMEEEKRSLAAGWVKDYRDLISKS